MKQDGNRDADEARFLRKHYKQGGYDEEEEEQDHNFKENLEKAIKNHSKKALERDVEKQIEYFGYKIEPFNMKEEEQMGNMDEDGFFVFNNKKRGRDAWLESLNEEGEEVIDKLRKKIKLEQREQTVFDADRKIQENYESDNDEDNQGQPQVEEGQEEIVDQNKLKIMQIKELLAQILPFGTSANQYMKKLKKEKANELYDKILFMCNQYIAVTGQHDILTAKKEDLEEDVQKEKEEKPIANWDRESSQEKVGLKDEEQAKDEDDIF